jgi:hypothetical protein
MNQFITLVGFIRPMLDIKTFAIPVFINSSGLAVVQCDKKDSGIMLGFEEVNTETGFINADFPISTRVGSSMLYAFETSDHSIALGTAGALSAHLKKALEITPDYRITMPHTVDAISRFAHFADGLQTDGRLESIFLMEKNSHEGLYNISFANARAPIKTTEKNIGVAKDWVEVLGKLLSKNHENQLDAHRYAIRQIEKLIEDSRHPLQSANHVALALSKIYAQDANDLRNGYSSLCNTCLHNLHQVYKSESGMDLVNNEVNYEMINLSMVAIANMQSAGPSFEPVIHAAVEKARIADAAFTT